MRAAIYARKSTDDSDRNVDNKSVTRQVENAKAFAVEQGWAISDERVFIDDGISGAEFKDRPGLNRMLNAVDGFDVLVMSEASRLGRDMTRNAFYLGEITDHGVRVFYYLSKEEERFDTPETRLMATLRGYASEVEREKASQRARDALERKAKKGFNTGGIVYGYDNVPVYAVGQNGEQTKTHTDYAINQEQAQVISSIFRMYADGHGFKAIAKALNGDSAREYPSLAMKYFGGARPQAPRKGSGSWSPTVVREMLLRERYIGQVPWGEYRKVYKGGTQTRVRNDNVLHVERPDLRIVPDELWSAVGGRILGMRSKYKRSIDALETASAQASRYLLSGLGRCSLCGSSVVKVGGTKGKGASRRNAPMYGCSHYRNRGTTVCANSHAVYQEDAETAVIEAISRQVLSADVMESVVDQAIAKVKLTLKKPDQIQDKTKSLRAEVAEIGRALERLSSALLSADSPLDTVLALIAKQEARQKDAQREIAELTKVVRPTDFDEKRLRSLLEERARGIKDLMRSDVPTARKALQVLLDGKIEFSPVMRDGKKTLSFSGKTKAGALLAPASELTLSVATATGSYIRMASPRGFEPRLPP